MPHPPLVGILAAVVLATADVHGADGTDAQALLAQAETAVGNARAKQALWLEAVRALAAAKAALGRGAQDESARLSRRAIELSELGMLQRDGGTGPEAGPVRRDQ